MKTFTIDDIRSWDPCYDPIRHLRADWSGTVLDLLACEQIPPKDRFWVVLREELLDAKLLRLFAVWCARQCHQTDQRCIDCIDTAERFANGAATREELDAAMDAARYASLDASLDAARTAARAAARYAAWDAARDAAWDAAWDASKRDFSQMIYNLFGVSNNDDAI